MSGEQVGCQGRRSIRKQLRTFFASTLCLALMALFASMVSGLGVVRVTRDVFSSYAHLSDFYQVVTEMELVAKDYVYAKDDADLLDYTLLLEAGSSHLNRIRMLSRYPETIWRISLLENMLISFSEDFDQVLSARTQQESFEAIATVSYAADLVSRTVPAYFGILMQEMRYRFDVLRKIWRWQLSSMACVMLVIGALGACFFSKIRNSVVIPIGQLVDNMDLIRSGSFTIKRIRESAVELSLLFEAFESMAESIRDHVEHLREKANIERRLLESENENLRIQARLAQVDLHMLQMQINPHMIYNTLSLITKMAYIEGAQETWRLMETFSELVHYSLSKSGESSTLGEEMLCIRNYMDIQKKRFWERLELLVQADADVPDIGMPAMIVQPLVENAIQHGLKDRVSGGRVVVSVSLRGSVVVLEVEDNGSGMLVEKVEELQSRCIPGQDTIQKSDSHGIGIPNVYERLYRAFGDACTFRIESEPDCGCVVTIELPVVAG